MGGYCGIGRDPRHPCPSSSDGLADVRAPSPSPRLRNSARDDPRGRPGRPARPRGRSSARASPSGPPPHRHPVAGGAGQRGIPDRHWPRPRCIRPGTTLVTSRLTSHSDGPGAASSKSFRSNIVPLRRRVQPEVAQVGVTTDDHVDAGHRLLGQIVRHEYGRAAIERERARHSRPALPDRRSASPRTRGRGRLRSPLVPCAARATVGTRGHDLGTGYRHVSRQRDAPVLDQMLESGIARRLYSGYEDCCLGAR